MELVKDVSPSASPASSASSANADAPQSRWRRWRSRLAPLSSGPQEIAALDGLRAVAALSVLVYHATAGSSLVIAGHDLTWMYFYTESGVDLFFTLSGFLLFQPYARAILDHRPQPAARAFYRRRALRILPAYYACLGVLVIAQWSVYATPVGAQNVLAHLLLLHDISPAFNRTINGPFWTLAVEWQFYLVLPLLAWGIGRLSAGSPRRLLAGVVGVIALALALRLGDALLVVNRAALPGAALPWIDLAQRVVIGSQGKYLEVFGVGMLCSVLYTLALRRTGAQQAQQTQRMRRYWLAGLALLALALSVYLLFGPLTHERRNGILAAYYLALRPANGVMLAGPLTLGIGYGALTLGVLLAPPLLRAPLEWAPLRFVGLISYSLYLWHEALLNLIVPRLPLVGEGARVAGALAVGVFVAIPFAYLSYQLVERPFLHRRQTQRPAPASAPRQACDGLSATHLSV